MQSTGQTSTHAVSFVPMQGSQMMYATLIIMIAQTCDPALTVLFTPPHPRVGRDEACTSIDALEALAERGRAIDEPQARAHFRNAGPADQFAGSGVERGPPVPDPH